MGSALGAKRQTKYLQQLCTHTFADWSPGLQCDPLSPPVFYTVCSTFEKPGFCKCVRIFIFMVSWWHIVWLLRLECIFPWKYVSSYSMWPLYIQIQMTRKYININTYVLFKITSKCVGFSLVMPTFLILQYLFFFWVKGNDFLIFLTFFAM